MTEWAGSSVIYDNHTLYIKYRDISKEQIYGAINDVMRTHAPHCRYIVNVVDNNKYSKDSHSTHAFLHVSDRRVYDMFLDGDLPSPQYTLSPQQIDQKRLAILEYNEDNPEFDPACIQIDNIAYLNLEGAMVALVDKSIYLHNILKCAAHGPKNIDITTLRNIFIPYSKSRDRYYPRVHITKKGVCYVAFDPASQDAAFALHMTRKTCLKLAGRTCTLFFTHATVDDNHITDILVRPLINNNGRVKWNSSAASVPKKEEGVVGNVYDILSNKK